MDCIPPIEVLQFGAYRLDSGYRRALDIFCPLATTEEIVGSYLGHNPNFPTQEKWLRKQRKESTSSNEDRDSNASSQSESLQNYS